MLSRWLILFGSCAAAAGTGEVHRYDLARPVVTASLGSALAEVSGVAFAADGRLYGHEDETARIVELDPATGRVLRRFALVDGRSPGSGRILQGDFEDIAVLGNRIFVVTSSAIVWEAVLDRERALLPARPHATRFEAACRETEGLAADGDVLLLLCKHGRRRGAVPVGAWSPATGRLESRARWVLAEAALARASGGRSFAPSALARFPGSDHWLIIAGPERAFVEIDGGGRVVAAGRFPAARHPQPEGLAFAADGRMYIADEGRREGRLTVYGRK